MCIQYIALKTFIFCIISESGFKIFLIEHIPDAPEPPLIDILRNLPHIQGCNARKVISEVYAFFVLQCTVFGRKSKHKTDVTA